MVSIDRVEKGIVAYLDSEIMTKLPMDGWRRVAAGAGMTIFIRRGRQLLESNKEHPLLNGLGLVNQAGEIDVEALRDALRANIPEQGFRVQVPAIGVLTFKQADVDSLYAHIMSA